MSSNMFRDIFGQAIEAMRHNLRRTSITVLGMAWGIATVVLLLAYGAGFGRAFETIFAQFGTNMIGIFPGTTSEQAGGAKAGVKVRLHVDDVEHIQESLQGVTAATPMMYKNVSVQNDLHSYTWEADGVRPRTHGHHEHGHRPGPLAHPQRPPGTRACRRHRLGSQTEALLRCLRPRPDHPRQRRQLRGRRRPQGQDAGRRRQQQPHRLSPLHHLLRHQGHPRHRRPLVQLPRRPHRHPAGHPRPPRHRPRLPPVRPQCPSTSPTSCSSSRSSA